MIKWFRKQNMTVKLLLLLIVVFSVGIAVRWKQISTEIADSFVGRFTTPAEQLPADSTEKVCESADTTEHHLPETGGADTPADPKREL